MKKIYEYSHLGGSEILATRYPAIGREIDKVISAVRVSGKTKVSREKTMRGRMLYSPKEMNKGFKQAFRHLGFNEVRLPTPIKIEDRSYSIEIDAAFKQIDFVKSNVLVEVQFGKYAFMFYDMAKFQYFFNEHRADVGVEIVPCHAMHKQMSTGVSYGEQLIHDIERLRRHFPAVPVKVILIDV